MAVLPVAPDSNDNLIVLYVFLIIIHTLEIIRIILNAF